MRNLKKFLALVLAMVMTFSLMLSVNAATTGTQYKDGNVDDAFVKAVDVLTGMGIFKGDDLGNLNAKQNVTRAEMAAIIYRLATGDVKDTRADLYKEYGNFVDVTPNDWYAGYAGYCANAEYIKGRPGNVFDASANVTGYEALAMVLRVVGYDKESEFTGATWQVNVSSLATRLGLVRTIKNANYDTNLQYPSTREVIASLVFEGIRPWKANNQGGAPMVTWTPSLHYQTWNVSGDMGTSSIVGGRGQSVGEYIFGLTMKDAGVLLGNGQTGEGKDKSIMGYAGKAEKYVNGAAIDSEDQISYSAYTWSTTVEAKGKAGAYAKANTSAGAGGKNTVLGNTEEYTLTTGIDLLGHNLELWYDNGKGAASNSGNPVFAYYDKATTEVVKAQDTKLDKDDDTNHTTLGEAIAAAGFKAPSKAVFNNSFGKFGTNFADADLIGDGTAVGEADAIASPVNLYKIICNNNDKVVDAVIALNIETSQITEANVVNRVPTLGVPVSNIGTVSTNGTKKGAQLETEFITHTENTKQVPATGGVWTGVIAKDALVGNSTSTLGDYEFGVHITGTSPRTVSNAEKTAINLYAIESAYYLMAKVTPDVSGRVVAFNVNEGTVTLENGTVLHRSKYYNTVVNTNPDGRDKYSEYLDAGQLKAADWALPQSVDENGKESYNPAEYEFFMDYEGNYLGAQRKHDAGFIYGTYLDYEQKTSTSTYTYYLTGIDLNGDQQTYEVEKYWSINKSTQDLRELTKITNTNEEMANKGSATFDAPLSYTNAPVPFRDTVGAGGQMNYIGLGVYAGFTINNKVLDANYTAGTINETDYFVNMERLGIKNAEEEGFDIKPAITKNDSVIGAYRIPAASWSGTKDLYLTEDTKFILVSGYGTDSAKGEVYDGITKLLDGATQVEIDWSTASGKAGTPTATKRLAEDALYSEMTYFKHSPYVYAQSGDVDQKVDVVILPKAAVTWTDRTSTLYYMGDPNYTMISSHEGHPIYQYTVYRDGVAEKVWLTNSPTGTTNCANNGDTTWTDGVWADTFLLLRDKLDGVEPTTGGAVYNAEFLNNDGTTSIKDGADGDRAVHTDHTAWAAFKNDTREYWPAIGGKNEAWANSKTYTITDSVIYSATSRNAQAATFTWDSSTELLRVAEADVTNLNTSNSPSGEIWPGITDLATLNEAGSINPVTGRQLKVAAQLDPTNPLVVTHIYVCWDQTPTRP